MGRRAYPDTLALLITADAGGSNGPRVRLWKWELQQFANRLGLTVTICHFPPGTSKWNKIEHRLFSHIAMNWRGKPLVDLVTIVSLIGDTTTAAGLRVRSEVDSNRYAKGVVVTDDQMAQVHLVPHGFHGDWNYTIRSIYIMKSGPNRAIFNEYGWFTVAHEFGHALHSRALGGIYQNGSCSSSGHSMWTAYNMGCAWVEGFADYHAAAILSSKSGYWTSDIIGSHTDVTNGRDIEGEVARTLYNLARGSSNLGDAYIASMVKDCRLSGNHIIGADFLVYCAEESVSTDASSHFSAYNSRHAPSHGQHPRDRGTFLQSAVSGTTICLTNRQSIARSGCSRSANDSMHEETFMNLVSSSSKSTFRWVLSGACLLLAIAVGSCSSPIETKPLFAAVVGFVSTSSGTPFAAATVRAVSYSEGCAGNVSATNSATTDARGHYRIRLTSPGGANPACIGVTAVRLENGTQDSITTSGAQVHFATDRSTGDEDSVRVDIRLP